MRIFLDKLSMHPFRHKRCFLEKRLQLVNANGTMIQKKINSSNFSLLLSCVRCLLRFIAKNTKHCQNGKKLSTTRKALTESISHLGLALSKTSAVDGDGIFHMRRNEIASVLSSFEKRLVLDFPEVPKEQFLSIEGQAACSIPPTFTFSSMTARFLTFAENILVIRVEAEPESAWWVHIYVH